jgi:hypothetical protein
MDEIKASFNRSANDLASGVAAAAESVVAGVDAIGAGSAAIEEPLRDLGREMLAGTKTFGEAIARHARERPLATFGIAFLAGVVVARALRR